MNIAYNLDVVSLHKIEGWAWLEGYTQTVTAEFYDIEEKLSFSLQAEVFRKDLKDAGIGNGCHSFSKEVDTSNISCIKLVHPQAKTVIIEINEREKNFEIEFDKTTLEGALTTLENKFLDISPDDLPNIFRNIPLDIFAKVLLNVPSTFPNAKKILPIMPSAYVQNKWTGSSGLTLLRSSCAFIRSLINLYEKLTERNIFHARVLDYGCGWGRLSRLLLKEVPRTQLFAADAWQESLDIFLASHIHDKVTLVDEYPQGPIWGDLKMDLIFLFSVFTHTSPLCTSHILSSLRQTIASDGVLIITVRPEEYWKHQNNIDRPVLENLISEHKSTGYAFNPHRRPVHSNEKIEDIPYGDCSISLDYLAKIPHWKIAALDYNLIDPLQTIVALKPC